MVEFRILGPLEVVAENRVVPLGGPKQRATLTILLLNANRVVSVERIADDLYAGAAPVTAVTQVQRQISELRKALGAAVIETRAPGYVVHLAADELDLHQFERLATAATASVLRGEIDRGAELFREGLALWRGQPLADLQYQSFAQTSIARLDELRLAAVEQMIDAELALGHESQLVPQLEQLVVEQPLRERFRAQLMLALYRAGRQADALSLYRATRERLVEELGLEPGSDLQALERAILAHDPGLAVARPASDSAGDISRRVVLVVPSSDERIDELLSIAAPLGRAPGCELIIARLLAEESELEPAASALTARRRSLGLSARTAAYTAHDLPRETARLATNYDAELVLLDLPQRLEGNRLPDELAAILERSPADVGVLTGSGRSGAEGVFVPFGGSEHDWSALELGASLALWTSLPLRLIGSNATRGAERDASRLLADASLAVQRVVGIDVTPLLVEPVEDALVAAVEPATVVVVGISERWRRDGIGVTRRGLLREAGPPVLLVHSGPRPGPLAPAASRTRFTWTLDAQRASG